MPEVRHLPNNPAYSHKFRSEEGGDVRLTTYRRFYPKLPDRTGHPLVAFLEGSVWVLLVLTTDQDHPEEPGGEDQEYRSTETKKALSDFPRHRRRSEQARAMS